MNTGHKIFGHTFGNAIRGYLSKEHVIRDNLDTHANVVVSSY